MPKYPNVICIVGPTAIGKTSLGITLARKFNTEIISADSRQFFKEMSIGTAKPTPEELAQAPHHFINSQSIHNEYSVGDFEKDALEKLQELGKTKELVVVVGGSGLYVDALLHGLDKLPKGDPEIRRKLNKQLENEGVESLAHQLKLLDFDYFNQVDLKNPQRIIRALEVCLTTGKPFSSFLKNQPPPRPFEFIKIGLNMDRAAVYERINKRVDLMMEQGLLNEVKSLVQHKDLNALQTVGYTELFDAIDEKQTIEEAVELIKRNTRRFAKRQLTWFNKRGDVNWFQPTETDQIIQCIELWLQKTQKTNS